jgi:hypothetical protein
LVFSAWVWARRGEASGSRLGAETDRGAAGRALMPAPLGARCCLAENGVVPSVGGGLLRVLGSWALRSSVPVVPAVGRPVEGCRSSLRLRQGGHDGVRGAPVGGVNQRGRPRQVLRWGS